MFNRTYQVRATRRAILAEVHKGFYRPAKRPDPRVMSTKVDTRKNVHYSGKLSLPFPLSERELAEDFAATFS